jgi:hypothetical protein
MDTINNGWDALVNIAAAEKISHKQGNSQRILFDKICGNGAACFTATKGLLEVIGNTDGH